MCELDGCGHVQEEDYGSGNLETGFFDSVCMSSMCPCGVKGWGIWAEWVDLNVCVVRVRCVALWGWELGKY